MSVHFFNTITICVLYNLYLIVNTFGMWFVWNVVCYTNIFSQSINYKNINLSLMYTCILSIPMTHSIYVYFELKNGKTG